MRMFGEFYGGDSAPCGERRDTGEGSGKARGVRGYDKGRVRAFLLAFVWVAEDSSESSVPSVRGCVVELAGVFQGLPTTLQLL